MRHTILPKLSGVIACLALAACGSSQKPEGKVNFDLNTSVAHSNPNTSPITFAQYDVSISSLETRLS